MGEALILEVTDQRGRVLQRHRLGAAPIGVGRGLRNGVIIDDPYIDPTHLTIAAVPDGTYRFRDLGSVNGTWEAHHRRVAEGPVRIGSEIRIGRTTLRFASADRPVPAALYDPTGQTGIVGRLLAPRAAALVLVGYLAISAGLKYIASSNAPSPGELLTPGLVGLLLAGIWGSAWAFTNRIVAQRFRFLAHWSWAITITTGITLLAIGFEWIGFFSPATDLGAVEGALSTVGGAWLLAGHFQLVTEWNRRRRWVIATGVAGGLVGLIAILGRPGALNQSSVLRQTGSLKPIAARFLPASDLDSYFAKAGDLKQAVDRMADDSTGAAESTPAATRSDSAAKR